MKKLFFIVILIVIVSNFVMAGPIFSIDKQKGGITPCLVSLFLDARLGYKVNDGKVNVDLFDVLKYVFPVVGLYEMYLGQRNAGCIGCLNAPANGYSTAVDWKNTKMRSSEKIACLIIPRIIMIADAFNGKRWSTVVKTEHLK